jgi:hypothetical protein
MVRKLEELPKFLVFNSGIESFGNSSIFAFYLLLLLLYRFLYLLFRDFCYGISDVLMSVFQMELNDYPHFFLIEDGRLCSMSQHCLGFPRLLYDALLHLGYHGDAPIYYCRLSKAHGLDRCEISVTILFDPTEP